VRLTGESFAPPAVRLENDVSASDWAATRPIDVLYVGNLDPQALRRPWRDLPESQQAPLFDPGFCEALADRVQSAPDRSLHLSLQEVMTSSGKVPPAFNVRLHVNLVEHYLRHLYRQRAVTALAQAGVRLRVVGAGAYFAQGRPPIHGKTVHGFTPCRSSVHEVGRAQLSVRDDDSSTAYFDISSSIGQRRGAGRLGGLSTQGFELSQRVTAQV